MAATQFNRDLSVPASSEQCWKVLTDVPTLIDWVSIVDDAKEISPLERYTAVLADRVGPFKLKADLDIVLSEVSENNRIRVHAAGEDRQVSSRIVIEAVLSLLPVDSADAAGNAGTVVSVVGSYEVVGKVAAMGASMIRQKATKILDEFFVQAGLALGAQ
jgi:carbon monoxide dehydrogenase subunit G